MAEAPKMTPNERADQIYKHPGALIIDSEQLAQLVEKDPDWIAIHATDEHPVIVTDYCRLIESPIRALSPHVLFQGLDMDGNSASFEGCANLKVAQGVFLGHANFTKSGVQEIDSENLVILKTNSKGFAAGFDSCENLKTARGRFPGWVTFASSGLEKIDTHPETGLVITGCDIGGRAASFQECPNLKIAEGTFPGFVAFDRAGIHTIRNLNIDRDKPFKAEFRGCENLTHCPKEIFDKKGEYSIMPTARKRIEEQLDKEDRARHALKKGPTLEL